ncbi:hypothetical protein [Paenibacillus sp. 32352]|uniref:hypothetical protein n=1 Tax=Paenibacillus sp. 32352 TaxID=1969111 RepID=UPI00117E3C60|nr:hypothetical protein [Paenibacillus sp. 32352]
MRWSNLSPGERQARIWRLIFVAGVGQGLVGVLHVRGTVQAPREARSRPLWIQLRNVKKAHRPHRRLWAFE